MLLIAAMVAVGVLLYPRGQARSDDEKPVVLAEQVRLDAVVQKLIDCESGGKSVRIIDSNGYYSYGILQFQKSTWDDFSEQSGIVGDPMVPNDAITMARWAVRNGYGTRWSCWRNVPKEWRQW